MVKQVDGNETVPDAQWRPAWWIAVALHALWVLVMLYYSFTWSDVRECGGDGALVSGIRPCWDSSARIGVWSFVIPVVGLATACLFPPYARAFSPQADRDGWRAWVALAFGSALVVGMLIALVVYGGSLAHRTVTTDLR